MSGPYIKWSNNSGHVESVRNTPSAFSHFTFTESRGEMIIVDIQGVMDLLTDPQIHSWDGEGFGEGNLGATGFALFFHTHLCNPICQLLNLPAIPIYSPKAEPIGRATDTTVTTPIKAMQADGVALPQKWLEKQPPRHLIRQGTLGTVPTMRQVLVDLPLFQASQVPLAPTPESAVHRHMARLWEIGRLTGSPCPEGALFHALWAAQLGDVDSLVALGLLYSQLPRRQLTLVEVEPDLDRAFQCLSLAAARGSLEAMVWVARGHERGSGTALDWKKAALMYRRVLAAMEGGGKLEDGPALWQIQASLAWLVRRDGGGGEAAALFREAAEGAAACRRGRRSAALFEAAEAEMTEEESGEVAIGTPPWPSVRAALESGSMTKLEVITWMLSHVPEKMRPGMVGKAAALRKSRSCMQVADSYDAVVRGWTLFCIEEKERLERDRACRLLDDRDRTLID